MSDREAAQSEHYGMSTVMTHKAYGKRADQSLTAVRDEAARLEDKMSRFREGSEISRINRSAGIKCESLSGETYEVLSSAAEFAGCCHGLFDITVGPLVDLWRKGKDAGEPPEDSSIRSVLPLINYEDLILDPDRRTAHLRRAGQSIDLGGIGKGYAGDRFLDIFKEFGIRSAYTNIGGNVVALGTKPDGSGWRVGIRHPRRENGLIGLVSVADKAVVTSGDYQRRFIRNDGRIYHHILDPSTGYPAESGLAGVTVVADTSMAADALSTVLFVAGMRKGLDILKGFSGVEAIFIGTDLQVRITAGLAECFQADEGIRVDIVNKGEGETDDDDCDIDRFSSVRTGGRHIADFWRAPGR